MSRRPSSSAPRSATAPYPRRTPGQPKSSRQQFSACGACRMRRVRCDLKDFYTTAIANGAQQPSCSNCKERSIKCVDEFAEVKAVKLLRRGRRLQQVEAVYGKVTDSVSAAPSVPQEPMSPTFPDPTATPERSQIPQMQPAFLRSSFFRRFCVQRPIIEPGEFVSRYIAHLEGTAPLNVEGNMLAMLLVTWAASFGIDEFGKEDTEDAIPLDSHNNPHLALDGGAHHISNLKRHARILRTEAMTREILTLVDLHGLLRRPSWDGVRVLLLLLPLTHGIQSAVEHLTTYEATLSQVYSLCILNNSPPVNSGLGPYCDDLIRARIFWYAYVHEGITTGLAGGRLLLGDDDITSLQNSLPPQFCASATQSTASAESPCSSPSPSPPVTPTFPFNSPLEPGHPRAALAYMVTTKYFSLALAVSHACRTIHSTLTGPRARRQSESGIALSVEAVTDIWDNLERCWDDFETLRRNPCGVGAAGGDLIRGEDVERFVSGWQVFIFGCLNVIREALPTKNNHTTPADQVAMTCLHTSAVGWCQKYLPRVIEMLQRHLKVPSNFFAYDDGLLRDGCFFAGLLLAQSDKFDAKRDMVGWDADWEDGVTACLQALGEVRWAYFNSHEQEKTLKAKWEARIERDVDRRQGHQSPTPFPLKQSPGHSPCLNDNTPLPYSAAYPRPRALSLVSAGGQARPHLPPLSITFPHDDSRQDAVLTDDGSGSWEAYTPPPTSDAITRTVVAHRSDSPISSLHHPTMELIRGVIKTKNPMFGNESDADQFSFTVEGTPDSQSSLESARWTPISNSYLDPRVVLTTSDAVFGCDDGFSSLGSNGRPYFS